MNHHPLILTFDLGTTRLKVAAFDLEGHLHGQVALRNREYTRGDEKWQSADDWWQNCIRGCRQLITDSRIEAKRIIGISLSGRAGAAIFINDAGEVLENPWSDQRHIGPLRELLHSTLPKPPLYAATLISKYLWLREKKPGLAGNVRHILYAKDYLLYRLTGQAATDPASGPDALVWPETLVSEAGLDPGILPYSQLPWTIIGPLNARAAADLGLVCSTPVCLGAHDGICANTGAGATETGRFAMTLGTHGVVRTICAQLPARAHRFYGFPENRHVVGANAYMAGRALDWFADNWFADSQAERPALFADLDRKVTNSVPGAGGISFLPYLAGQIAPERVPGATGIFHGLRLEHTRLDMFRAVLEGSGFAVCRVFQQVCGWVGEPESIHVTGSGVLCRSWLSVISNTLQQPLEISDASSEGRGAAIFCAMALNRYGSLAEATHCMVRTSRTVDPDPAEAPRYRDLYDRWTGLSTAMTGMISPD